MLVYNVKNSAKNNFAKLFSVFFSKFSSILLYLIKLQNLH